MLSRQLLQIDFDQFHRYAAVAVLLKPLIVAENRPLRRPVRILEMGCHSLNLLPAFLTPLPIQIVRADLGAHFEDGTGPYIQISKDAPLPFADGSFDYVVAMEVLEHIPADDRSFALSEWKRVCRQGVMLSYPNGKRVRRAERRADRAYRQRHEDQPHPWLDEHEQFGQPTPREVRSLCDKLGLSCHGFANSPLAEWLPLLIATEVALETGSPDLVKRFNEMMNLRPFRCFIQEPAYRRIYAAFKSENLANHALRHWQGDEAFRIAQKRASRSVIDPVQVLSKTFIKLLKEKDAACVSQTKLQSLERLNKELKEQLLEKERELIEQRSVRKSLEKWQRLGKRIGRGALRRLKLFRNNVFPTKTTEPTLVRPSEVWLARNRPNLEERQRLATDLRCSAPGLNLAIVVHIPRNADLNYLRRTLQSLIRQEDSTWSIWLSATQQFDAEQLPEIAALQDRLHWLAADDTICLSEVYQQCVDQSRTTYLLPVTLGDELVSDAILQFLAIGRKHPEAALLYADEDHINDQGEYLSPLLKPELAPESFRLQPLMLGQAIVVNCQRLHELGGFHSTYEGALCVELFHRVLDQQEEIVHLPRVLLHRSLAHPLKHGQLVVQQRLADQYRERLHKTLRKKNRPLVSIIVPSAGRTATIQGQEETHLSRCLASIHKKSTYSNFEIIVVHNGQLPPKAEELRDQYSLKSVSVPGQFNFSRSINRAVEAAHGDHLLLLNDDTEIITPEWIDKLLLYSCQKGIGAVGAKLLFPTGKLQHVGIALSPAGPGHPYYGMPRETPGYLNYCQEPRNWIAVTGACLMTPRTAFEAVCGFDESFELNYNDVDFCLRLWEKGFRCVCNPEVELYHYEAMRADGRSPFRPSELAMFNARWQKQYSHDPFFVSEPG